MERLNVNEVFCPKAGFSSPAWLAMESWNSTEVGGYPLPFSDYWLGISQPEPFVYKSPAENSATLLEKGEVDH